jgi:hypothetical protein
MVREGNRRFQEERVWYWNQSLKTLIPSVGPLENQALLDF